MKKSSYTFGKYRGFFVRSSFVTVVLFAFMTFAADSVFGQENYTEQVTIVGSYDPTINQAFKINIKPEIFQPEFQQTEFSFQTMDRIQATQVTLTPIEPISFRPSQRTESYNNYLSAGIGSWITPYLAFNHSSGVKNDYRFNASLYHLSSWKNIPDYSPSNYSNNEFRLGYEKYAGEHIIGFGLQYGLNTNKYYGFMPADYEGVNINENNLSQMFNLIKLDVAIKSNYKKENKLHHTFDISGYYYFDKYESAETNAAFAFDLYKAFKVSDALDYQNLGLAGNLEYYGNKDSVRNTTDVYFDATPYFSARYNIIGFKIGLKFAYLMSDENKFAFNPIVDVNINVIPEGLTIYAGADGGLAKNSFYELTATNPWFTGFYEPLQPDTTFIWQNNKFRVFGGVRGNIAKQLSFNLEASYLSFSNMPFYINSFDQPVIWGKANPPLNKFTAYYDDGNLFTFSGELSYALGTELKIWLNGAYNTYSLDSLAQPYEKTLSRIGLGASYLIMKKVNVQAEIFSVGKRYAVEPFLPQPTEVVLDSFIDLNLRVDYYVSDNFSVFLSGSNLLNKNYQRFYNYPVQGLEIMGGIGYRF